MAERVRCMVAAHSWPLRRVTISVGAAAMSEATRAAEELVAQADRALAASKAAGKDRVTHFHGR